MTTEPHSYAHDENFPVLICGGELNGTHRRADILKHATSYTKDRTQDRDERIQKGFPLTSRVELDLQPKLDGYIGPMWDGGKLRYETPEIYEIMST